VRGTVQRISEDESDEYFASRPRESQIGAWASPQSQPIADRSIIEKRMAEFRAKFENQDVPRPASWGGWCLTPNAIEFWQGRPSRLHDRFIYTLDATTNQWQIQRLAP
jgi:pyridoxamine 5'-phosphate oxidase